MAEPEKSDQKQLRAPRWSRRDLLRSVVGGSLTAGGLYTLKRVFLPGRLESKDVDCLTALLDTVLPDGEFPGHRASGILQALVNDLQAGRQKRRAVREGLRYLERQARSLGTSGFSELDLPHRAQLFAKCGAQPDGSVLRFFYRVVRDGAMRLHYAQPVAWKRVGLPNPPQPDGYPDYAEAPHG